MSLITCSECNAKVSDQAGKCPQCGAKVPKPAGRLKIFFLGLVIIFMVKCTYDSETRSRSEPVKTAAQVESEKRANEEFMADARKVRALRAATKNPDSFNLVSAGKLPDGTLCIIYRGTNSFNAIVTESKAILSDGRLSAWDKTCAGKSAEDVSKLRHAL